MGHVGAKTRSLGQILEKPCACSRCHIFSSVIMKRGQSVCLDEILDEYENGSCWLKTRSPASFLENPRGHILNQIIMKSGQNNCLD